MERYQEIERSLIKRFRKEIWVKFIRAINDYQMIKPNDKIAVCISGGKDSMLLAKCMQEIQKHGKMDFELKFIVMDPGYNPANRQKIIDNAKIMNIPIQIFDSNIFESVVNIEQSPCYLCARMRRGCLYSKAKELGCNKIALGHHFDDMIETLLLNMTYASEIKTMLPKLKSTNFEGMELIRPLYKVKEKDIIAWANFNELKFLQCACRFTAESEHNEEMSKRKEIKALIKEIKKVNPAVDDNLFRSIHNVNLASIVGWRDKDNGEKHSYLEKWDEL